MHDMPKYVKIFLPLSTVFKDGHCRSRYLYMRSMWGFFSSFNTDCTWLLRKIAFASRSCRSSHIVCIEPVQASFAGLSHPRPVIAVADEQ